MDKKEIQKLIQELLEKTKLSDGEISISECLLDPKLGNRCFSVEMRPANHLLNKEGEGLQAFNHLVRRIVEKKNGTEPHAEVDIMVDINGFQKKKIENLKSLVHMMSERARYFKSSIELEPMSAYDRRLVHEFLSDANDLKTESDGFGKNRRVIIKYTGLI